MTRHSKTNRKVQPTRNTVVRFGSLVLVALAIGAIGVKLLSPSHAAAPALPFQQGTFINESNGGPFNTALVPGYEAWLGHPIDIAEGNGNSQSYPASISGDETALDQPWMADAATSIHKRLAVNFPYMTHNQATGKSDGETYATMAVGSNILPSGITVDQRYKAFGQYLVSHGQANAIIRMGSEFNLNGVFYWAINLYDSTQLANFVSAERLFSTDIRSVPGQHFTLDWNFALDPANPGMNIVTNAYPGDAYVDEIGIDSYDQVVPYGGAWTTPQDQWSRRYNGYNGGQGLKFYLDFARAHGKKVAFPEWALGWIYGPPAPLEDPYYINQMFALMKDPANNVAWESYWEDSNGLYTADSAHKSPQSIAAFLGDFNSTSAPTPAPTSTPATTPAPSVSLPFRMRAGSANYTDTSGNTWVSDASYTTDGSTDSQGVGKITGTSATTAPSAIYENERWSNPHIGYTIPVANGTYTLKLHFAEISPNVTAAGQRVFSGTAEGKTIFSNLDIFSEVGADKPDDKTYTVTVTGGSLRLSLDSTGTDASKLSGLELLASANPTPTPSPTPTGCVVIGDVNGDCHVTSIDLATLLSHWNQTVTPNTNGDFNGDSKVTTIDLAMLLSNWGK